jgi:hypothetical protein
VSVRDAPEVLVKNLIRDAWDETLYDAGEQFVPSVHHGWVDPEGDVYEITISNPDESPVGGGETGYTGIDPSGAGPVQEIGGTVDVNCWAARDRAGTNGVSLNPRKAAFLMKWQVEQILRDHATATDASGAETDMRVLAPRAMTRTVDPDEEPPMWRWNIAAGYQYQARP